MERRTWTATDSGFSLPEMLIVLALIGLVLATAYMMLSAGTRMADGVEARDAASSQGQIAMEQMTREMRQSLEPIEGAGTFGALAPRSCTFYTDLDHNRVPERITYRVDGLRILRTVAVSTTSVPPYTFGAESAPMVVTDALKTGWGGTIFQYYDTDENVVPASTPADVSAVKISLQTQGAVGRSTAYASTSSWVRIRTVHNSIR